MKTKPVSFYVEILRVILSLLPQEIHVNKVWYLCRKKTGFKNKKTVIDAIEDLKKYGIVTKTRVNQQKKIVKITQLGTEIINLMDNLDKYKTADTQLKKRVKEHFDIIEGQKPVSASQLRYKLEQKGWKSDEIPKFHEWLEEVFTLEYLSSFAIFDALPARYAAIVFKYNPDQIAKEILNKLVTDAITDYLLVRLDGLLSEKVISQPREHILYNVYSQLARSSYTYFLNFTPPVKLNRFVQNETVNLVKALFYILSPPKHYLNMEFGRQASKDPKVKQQLNFLEDLTQSA